MGRNHDRRRAARCGRSVHCRTPRTRSAAGIWRGAARRLIDADHAVLAELPLGNGRRADLVAIDRAATITIVEVKSGRADFLADRKWQAYLGFCDRFYFAVDRDFPLELLPESEGLILADRFGGEIVREAPLRPLSCRAPQGNVGAVCASGRGSTACPPGPGRLTIHWGGPPYLWQNVGGIPP